MVHALYCVACGPSSSEHAEHPGGKAQACCGERVSALGEERRTSWASTALMSIAERSFEVLLTVASFTAKRCICIIRRPTLQFVHDLRL